MSREDATLAVTNTKVMVHECNSTLWLLEHLSLIRQQEQWDMSQPAQGNFRLSMQFLSSPTSILSLLSSHECKMNRLSLHISTTVALTRQQHNWRRGCDFSGRRSLITISHEQTPKLTASLCLSARRRSCCRYRTDHKVNWAVWEMRN